jgi:phytoene synthase
VLFRSRLVARLVFKAEEYEESARFGTSALGNRAAWAVLAAARIYGGIGRKVRDAGEAGLESRMSTSKAEKARAVAVAFGEALVRRQRWPMPGPSRVGLWTMPD